MSTMIPLLLEGRSVLFLSDLHAGKATYGGGGAVFDLTPAQHRICGIDIDYLAQRVDAIAVGGDLVDWRATVPEDANYNTFRAGLSAATRAKLAETSGNHDLASYTSPFQSRTAEQWSAAVGGLPKYVHKPDVDVLDGTVQVVSLSQETMRFNEWLSPAKAAEDARPEVKPGRGFLLSDNEANPFDKTTALGYLRSRLDTGRPTWICMHYPLRQHFNGDLDQGTIDKLTDIITSYTNVIGVLSGHRHANYEYDVNHARQVSVAGHGRTVLTAGINGPAMGGQMARSTSPDPIEYPWTNPFMAMLVTYRPGVVTVRWRDLIKRRWVKGVNRDGVLDFSHEIAVSCNVPIRVAP